MTAEVDIAAIDDGGANTASEVRTALTSVLARADAGTILNAIEYIDTPPASPDALDDEFDDESVTGWSELNIGSVVYSEENSALLMGYSENVNQLRGLYKAAPSSQDFTIVGKITKPPTTGNVNAFVFLGESTSGQQYTIGFYSGTTARALQYSTPTSAVASWGSSEYAYCNYLYVKMVWDNTGGTLAAYYSYDGVSWSDDVSGSIAGGWTPAIVGVGYSNRSSTDTPVSFDFIRRTA